MTYFARFFVSADDSPSIDGFGRWRISSPSNIFDNKQLHNSGALYWTNSSSLGATSVFNSNRASTTLTVPTTDGARFVRQTKTRMRYQPGKSLLMFSTFVMDDGVTNVIKRGGIFDDLNGVFLEQSGTNVNLVIRSNVSGTGTPIENRISQSQWNLDVLNGSGSSGETLDLSRAQIYVQDLEWLGVGRVRCGFVFDGQIVYVHKFNHANVSDSVYMSTPNLPVRYEILNDGASAGASLEHICTSVSSEGGYDAPGVSVAVDRGVNPITVPSGSLVPIISIRTADPGTSVLPTDITLLCTTNASFRWALFLNPTIGGTDNVNWQTVENTNIQFDTSRNNTNTLTSGTLLSSGYGQAQSGGGSQVRSSVAASLLASSLEIGANVDGTLDELVLAVEHLESGNESFFASVQVSEFF